MACQACPKILLSKIINMKKNYWIIILVIILLALTGYFWYSKNYKNSDTIVIPTPSMGSETPVLGSNTEEMAIGSPSDNVITYTDSGFSPGTITIKIGESVKFVNNSSQSVWPASAVHPTHRIYPTIGGCIGSTFDACRGLQPEESWSFTFEIKGTWKYHNHLNATQFGTVVVE